MSSSRDSLRLPMLLEPNSSSSSAAGVPTLTTPTLTPTTLRNIEQMFLDSEECEQIRPPDPHENAARFEPPTVTMVNEYKPLKEELPEVAASPWSGDASALPGPHSNTDDLKPSLLPPPPIIVPIPPPIVISPPPPPLSAQVLELSTLPLRLLPTEPVPPTVGVGINNNHNGTDAAASPASDPPPSKKAASSGRRRGNSSANLTPEEAEKKELRRLRNKEAAARCRKRRLDQTISLQEEVDAWEAKKANMEEEVRSLEVQKLELEALLREHRSVCNKCVENGGCKVKKEVMVDGKGSGS